ncbi:MAG: copper homeostasis protein CutC [Erysipelotrichaceae bacterium]
MVEVCIETYEDALVAKANGVERVELNAALALGGLTPSVSLCKKVKALGLEVIAMVRLRGDDFYFSEDEMDIMLEDARSLLEQGADGIAFGSITTSQQMNWEHLRRMQSLCALFDKTLVIHRAVDQCIPYLETIQCLKNMGITRVLTSGGASDVAAGTSNLKQAVAIAAPTMTILAGCGVTPANVQTLKQATKIREVHGSFSKTIALPYLATVSFASYADQRKRCLDAVCLRQVQECFK